MDEEDNDYLQKLKKDNKNKTVRIYRGWNLEERECGHSWTLDRDRAVWFAERFASRFDDKAFVTSTIISLEKGHCHAYFNNRNEEEILWTGGCRMDYSSVQI